MNKIIKEQRRIYGQNFETFGPTPHGTFQNNLETQYARYDSLLKILIADYQGSFSIHDVGAGICDLHKFLLDRQIKHSYSATEIIEGMAEYSMQKYSEVKVYTRDILDAKNDEVYDFVVLSGTLNISGSIPPEVWYYHTLKVIEKMYSMASKGISFNFLSSNRTFSDPSLVYLNPTDLFQYCIDKLSRFVHLDHAYPLYEATITVFRKDYIKSFHNKPEFEKDFK
jgi:hypothetical protein